MRRLDERLGGLLAEASAEEDFTGKAGQSTILRLPGLGFKRLGLVGLGSCKPSSAITAYRGIGEAVAAAAKSSQANNAAVVLASEVSDDSVLNAASAIVLGTRSITIIFEVSVFLPLLFALQLLFYEILSQGCENDTMLVVDTACSSV